MVRAIIFISALLIAAVTAAPSPDPLIGAKVNKYIGLGKVRATHVGKNLLNLDGLKVHGTLKLKKILSYFSNFLFS